MSEGDGSHGWEIYRLEFAFLNPEEYRWQMFQYWPAEEGAVPTDSEIRDSTDATYRRQAQKLLKWVSTSLENLEWTTKSGEIKKHKFQQKNENVCLNGSNIKNGIIDLLKSNGDSSAEATFLELIENYSDSIKSHFERDSLNFPEDNIFDRIKGGDENISIGSKFAIDLISSLYISHDWDIFGRLAYCADSVKKINASTLGSVSYALTYPDEGSKDILGYPVEIVHLSSSKLRKVVHMKDDYFSFCNEISNNHINWYRVYGHIIDEINKDAANSETNVYLRCFPLRICGYDHFLQIFLRPIGSVDDSKFYGDVPELFSRNHREGVPSLIVFKECLRELIVQMHVATFQRRVSAEFMEKRSETESDDDDLAAIFARHAPNLVKMEGLWVNDRYYTYVASGPLGFKQWQATGDGDDAWVAPPTCGGNESHYAQVVSGKIIAKVPWEDDYKDLAKLLDGTGEMRLEEQWHWLKNEAKRRAGPGTSEPAAKQL